MIEVNAGNVIAITAPLTASSTTSIQIWALSVITSPAATAWVPPITTMPTLSTKVSGRRSATTPPKSRNSTIGTVLAASTSPSALVELSMDSTANASATPAIVLPAVFTVLATKYHRKFGWLSGARGSRPFRDPDMNAILGRTQHAHRHDRAFPDALEPDRSVLFQDHPSLRRKTRSGVKGRIRRLRRLTR